MDFVVIRGDLWMDGHRREERKRGSKKDHMRYVSVPIPQDECVSMASILIIRGGEV